MKRTFEKILALVMALTMLCIAMPQIAWAALVDDEWPTQKTGIVYNGQPQTIINKGEYLHGDTMYYKLLKTGSVPSAEPEKVTDAGVYKYEYGYMDDDVFVSQGSVNCYIEKKDLIVKVVGTNTKTYGDSDPVIQTTLSGLVDGESPKQEDISNLVTRESGENVKTYNYVLNANELNTNGNFNPNNYECKLDTLGFTKFEIIARSINDSAVTVTVDENPEFEGYSDSPILNVSVVYKEKELVEGSLGDYLVEMDPAYEPGFKAEYRINGRNNFNGTISGTFTVAAKNISKDVVISSIPDQTYTGSNIAPEMTVAFTNAYGTGILLEKDKDYELFWDTDYKDAGTVKFHIEGVGVYTGRLAGSFKITKKAPTIDMFTLTIPEDSIYDGQVHKAVATLNNPYSGCDYEVFYKDANNQTCSNPIDVGTYTVYVEIGDNGDNISKGVLNTGKTFTISKKSVTITPKVVTKKCYETDPELEYTIEGVVPGDDLAITFTREPGEEPGTYNVLSYTITGADQDKYDVMVNPGVALIIEQHEFSTDWQSDENGHWHECACGEKTDIETHVPGEDWIVDKPASFFETGNRHKECKYCKMVLETEEIPVESILITFGDGVKYTKGKSNAVTMTCNAPAEYFTGLYIDGSETPLDPSNYAYVSGSTVVTFSPKYLASLPAGDHTVVFEYLFGSTKVRSDPAILTIENEVKKDTAKSPDTGDDFALTYTVILSIFAVAILFVSSKKRAY